jgi:peptidyl-prolyl cis-trans isomerase A (cyclophilin A)
MNKLLTLSAFLLLTNLSYSQDYSYKPDEAAPDTIKVEFLTTQGSFVIEVYREWSPKGVDRFYTLVKNNYYEGLPIFRVIKNFVVQFGISNDPELNIFWEKHPIEDEPVKSSNLRGAVAYARSGEDSRTTQLFINLKDNTRLDTVNYSGVKGFPPIGIIVEGMDVIDNLYSEYGESPSQDSITVKGREYTERVFPKMDYINKTVIIRN